MPFFKEEVVHIEKEEDRNSGTESEGDSYTDDLSYSSDDLSDSDDGSVEISTISDYSLIQRKQDEQHMALFNETREDNKEEKPKTKENLKEKKKDLNSNVKKVKAVKRKKKRRLTICLRNCRYEIVREVAKSLGISEVPPEKPWDIFWTDFSISLERAIDMKRFQIVNHFPGMNEICRKDLLSKNLNRMRKAFPEEYDIFPKTWCLPSELGELQTYGQTYKNKTFICKPEMGCQGKGIFLVRNLRDLNPFGRIICQIYIARPFLIDGLKFDLRVYVLITSCDPLRIYVYNEGLARFATAKYKPPTTSNKENSYMHLTNYSVNKYSQDYVIDEEAGSKRKLSSVYNWFKSYGFNSKDILDAIDDVIIKTIISAQPVLKHNYRTCFPSHDEWSACFEILGFDILLDHKLKPYVLEVNHSPSFHTDSKLDTDIKEMLIRDTFQIINLKNLDRRKIELKERKRVQERLFNKNQTKSGEVKTEAKISQATSINSEKGEKVEESQFEYELKNRGEYRLIFPALDQHDKYAKFIEQNLTNLYRQTEASQARAICNKLNMINQQKKQEEEKKKRMLIIGPQKSKTAQGESLDASKLKKVRYGPRYGPFAPIPIIADEELDRVKALKRRGMLIRSLGIELQAFNLLIQTGTIKPEEEVIFKRLYGFNSPATMSAKKV